MKRNLFFCLFTTIILSLLTGCTSSAPALFPPTEQSQAAIDSLRPQLDSLETQISSVTNRYASPYSFVIKLKTDALDKILDAYAQYRINDIGITFLPTHPLWQEEKNTLGISYVNYINVDSGSLAIDLKKFRIKWAMNNMMNVEIELEGKGMLSASGQYTGVSASISPQIHFYLNDYILFSVRSTDSDAVTMTPQKKTLLLKTKITATLLQWTIPYYKEIPLQAEQMLQPIRFPVSLSSEIVFPIPAATFGSEKFEFVRRELRLSDAGVFAKNNILELHGNITFIKH